MAKRAISNQKQSRGSLSRKNALFADVMHQQVLSCIALNASKNSVDPASMPIAESMRKRRSNKHLLAPNVEEQPS